MGEELAVDVDALRSEDEAGEAETLRSDNGVVLVDIMLCRGFLLVRHFDAHGRFPNHYMILAVARRATKGRRKARDCSMDAERLARDPVVMRTQARNAASTI